MNSSIGNTCPLYRQLSMWVLEAYDTGVKGAKESCIELQLH